MKKEEKYYSPSLDEIHSGLECEIINITRDEGWEETTLTPGDVHDIFSGIFVDDEIIAVRIKYLDKEDIEALGCTETVADGLVAYRIRNFYIFWYGEPMLSIDGIGKDEYDIVNKVQLFRGFVYNKSELKWIMKRLGI